jgi:LPS-assembly protein
MNVEFTTAYVYYYRDAGQKGHFYDLKPTVSLPLNLGGYAKLTPEFGVWETLWQRDDQQPTLIDKQGHRSLYRAALNLTTEVSRVFNVGGKSLEKLRHGVKPELSYTYVPDVTQNDLPDYIAPVREQHTLSYGLTNSFLARWKDGAGRTDYREFLRIKFAQIFDIKESSRDVAATGVGRKPFGDVALEVDFTPFQHLSFLARNIYSVNDAIWRQANYDMALSSVRGDTVVLGYRYTQDAIEEINLSLKAVLTKSLDLSYRHRRNQLIRKDFEKRLGVRYHQQCWSVELSYAETLNTTINSAGFSVEGDKIDRTYMLNLSLYGLGTIGK